MCFVFDNRRDVHERGDLVRRDAARHRFLQVREVAVDAAGDLPPPGGRRDHERAAILGADGARDKAARGESIENARQRRALVGEAAVQLGDRRRRRGGEQRQDVRLALRQAVVRQAGQIQADSVRRSMNGWNQTQRHGGDRPRE